MFRQYFTTFLLIFGIFIHACQYADAQKKKQLLKRIDQNFLLGVGQYKLMRTLLPSGTFPKTYYDNTGKFETRDSWWWVSGFYPGTLLYLYEESKDTALYREAMRMLSLLEKEQYNKTTHDLGFMMFCSFGNALRIRPQQEYNEILITSAYSLASRFDPTVGCIKSWDGKPNEYLVIIDNMMNLELLFWAFKQTGDSTFYRTAVVHANTTMKNHFRKDHSSYHVVNYDLRDGSIIQKRTAQGHADESAWARGQAWGLYGYTVMYRETQQKQYLTHAQKIAGFLVNHPDLPSDKIPYWDYDAPNVPDALRDASAAAIQASALLELSKYVPKKVSKKYFRHAESILYRLSQPQYLALAGTNGGFMLKHSVGSLPEKSEVDVPLTYADYYFAEAMQRYKYYTIKK